MNQNEKQAIIATALDYLEGWFTSDANRMQRSLHPDLAKRRPGTQGDEKDKLIELTASALIDYTAKGGGKDSPAAKANFEVIVQDLSGNMSQVKTITPIFIDYIQMAKIDNRWVIVNVL